MGKTITQRKKGEKRKKVILTDKETLFCNFYVKYNFNATTAYRDAYKKENLNSASTLGHRLLKKVKIGEKISELMEECFNEAKISQTRILNQLSIQSFQQISDYLTIDQKTGLIEYKSLEEMGEKGAAIQSIKVKQTSLITGDDIEDINSSREAISTEIDLKLRPNEKSLELLMKHKGMIADKNEHTFPGGEFSNTKQVDLSGWSDEDIRKYIELSKKALARNDKN